MVNVFASPIDPLGVKLAPRSLSFMLG